MADAPFHHLGLHIEVLGEVEKEGEGDAEEALLLTHQHVQLQQPISFPQWDSCELSLRLTLNNPHPKSMLNIGAPQHH